MTLKSYKILLAVIGTFFFLHLSAQKDLNECDTVRIIAPAYLVLDDTSIHVSRDTVEIICDKYIVLTKKNGYSLYKKLVGESEKHEFVDKLFQGLIAASTQDTMLIDKAIMNAEDVYKPYSGKIIRNISIKVLKPFGASISDTNLPVVSKWGQALNKSHISTNKWVLRNKLMFKENEKVNPFEFVENTNILSSLPYLQDATIIVTNAVGDSVDVLVLAKDKFPWLPAADIYSINKMTAYLTNVNILGMGHSLKVGMTMNTKSIPTVYMSDIKYYNNNIYKQISVAGVFTISDNSQKYQFLLNRDVVPLSVRQGGGVEISQIQENIVIDPTDIDRNLWYFKYRYYELWTSYLFYDKTKKDKDDDNHTYFIPAIATYKRDYLYRPFVSIDSNTRFVNYSQLLGNIAVVQQSFIRTNYLMSFGKAEYIPYGFQATVTGGYTWTEFMQKPYLGFGLKGTRHFKDLGYIFGEFQVGSHFDKELLQGAINFNLSFLSRTIKQNRYRYRFFVGGKYTRGINRFTNDLLYLGEDYGFIGMNDKVFYGQKRIFMEFYGISYTPWYFLGFRFAVFGFCSGSFLGYEGTPLLKNQFLSSFGFGIYTKNDFLAFSSFQVRLAYFPITPSGISHYGLSFSSTGLLSKMNFLKTKPQVVKYK